MADTSPRRTSDAGATIAAALVLVIGLGFGRFAFTGLYPLMVAEQQISVAGGSYAASANYAGYLIGALLTALPSGIPSRRLCTAATAATVISLGILSLPLAEWLVIFIRGLSGLFSAVCLVAVSNWLIRDRGQHDRAPALYSGVGIGIFLSAEMIGVGHAAAPSSHMIWLALAATVLTLTILCFILQRRAERSAPHQIQSQYPEQDRPLLLGPTRLIVIYGLAGLGYIMTATYLPLLVRSAFASVDPVHTWAVFGLGAGPSCFLWHKLHQKLGTHRSLMINLLVQAIGVVLPVLHTPLSYIVSALLVGGTFMGTVTIAMPAARKLAARVRFNMLAIMTAAYGTGQIVGPLIANMLYARSASFDASLMVAAFALLLAGALCFSRTPENRTSE